MEAVGAFVAVYLVFCLVILGVSVVQYVLQSLGLYSMAKRRGINNPWLAWVPVGNVWILGCISDQYQYVARGLDKSKRKLLMGLYVVVCVMLTVYFALIIGVMATEHMEGTSAVGALSMVFVGLGMIVISVWYSILVYMAQYDLFRSADPGNATLYLVLSLLLGSIVNTILIFICRNKDGGMPPRQVAAPVAVPSDPWQGTE